MSGVLAYVFFALVTRALGAETAAPVAVLWAWWSFAAAAFTFPVQHWIARTAATAAGEAAVRRGLPRVAGLVAGVSVVAGAVAWLARDRLFGPDGTWFPLLVVAVGICSGALGLARGTLSGRHRFGAVGVGLVLENGLRCVVAAVLMGTGNEHPAATASPSWPGTPRSGCGRRRSSRARPAAASTATRSGSSRAPRPDSCSRRSRSPVDRCCWPRSAAPPPR